MNCAECRLRIGMDWIEWRERHTVNLGDHCELVTVHEAVLCPPPRVCAAEYAEGRNLNAKLTTMRQGDEPF